MFKKNGTVICFTIEFPTDRIICTRNDHLCWQGKKKKEKWNSTEQFQSSRSSVTSLTLKGLVFAVFTRHIR